MFLSGLRAYVRLNIRIYHIDIHSFDIDVFCCMTLLYHGEQEKHIKYTTIARHQLIITCYDVPCAQYLFEHMKHQYGYIIYIIMYPRYVMLIKLLFL